MPWCGAHRRPPRAGGRARPEGFRAWELQETEGRRGRWGHFRAGAEAGSRAGPAWEAVWPAWAGRKLTVLEPLSCGTLGVWLRTPLLRPLGRRTELQCPALVSLGRGPRVQTTSPLCTHAQTAGPAVLMSASVRMGRGGLGPGAGRGALSPSGKVREDGGPGCPAWGPLWSASEEPQTTTSEASRRVPPTSVF